MIGKRHEVLSYLLGETAVLPGKRRRADAATVVSRATVFSDDAGIRSRSSWMHHQPEISAAAMSTTSSPPSADGRPKPPFMTRVASDRKRSVNESARLLAILASRCRLSITAAGFVVKVPSSVLWIKETSLGVGSGCRETTRTVHAQAGQRALYTACAQLFTSCEPQRSDNGRSFLRRLHNNEHNSNDCVPS